MRFLPVVERELRVASRKWGTYWMRAWVALAVVCVSTWIVLVNGDESPRDLAQILYYTITGGALLYCTLIGVRATADCISEEKREGTLGLLFLTDLKGYDVVLGKLVANSLNGFYGLATVFPIVAIVLMLGGITGMQIARVSLVLLNTMFFSVCIGIFASACSRSSKRAISSAIFLIMFFSGMMPAIAAGIASRFQLGSFSNWEFLMWMTPTYSYVAAQELPMRLVNPYGYVASMVTIHVLAWVFLLLACFVAPRSWQDNPAGTRKVRWRERWKNWSYGAPEVRHAYRRELLNANAFYWLAARDRLKPAWVWAFLGLCAAGWLWGLFEFDRDWLNAGVYVATAFTLNSILKNWFAQEATRQFAEERNAGSLELLLSTSLTVPEILRGQALALRRQFLGPFVLVLVTEIIMMDACVRGSSDPAERETWISVWLAGMIMLIADLVALYWVGMWMGLASKNPKRAYSETIGRVLAVPWVIFALFIAGIILVSIRVRSEPSWQLLLGVWFVTGLLVDVLFGLSARQNLLTEFRDAATRRFQRSTPLWRRVLGLESNETERAK